MNTEIVRQTACAVNRFPENCQAGRALQKLQIGRHPLSGVGIDLIFGTDHKIIGIADEQLPFPAGEHGNHLCRHL